MRRQLPPLNAVRAFEAAARHLSFTKASDELCVTQGAISRHVAGLEAQLGTALFMRRHRSVALTDKGVAFFHALRDAFDRIEDATRRVSPPANKGTLRIKLPPTLAIRWVVPRLARLHALDRAIDVQITTSHAPVDFGLEDVDVAIHSGSAPPSGVVAKRLFGETLLPVCSPALLKGARRLRKPGDLAGHVLLCSLHRRDDWPNWIAAAGIADIDGNDGLKFENSSLAYQAAIDNLGIVMAQKALVADDLATKRLVAPFRLEVVTPGAYYLVYPPRSASLDTVRLFDSWILDEAARSASG
jgi:LysR family glycine cleavage system transcriptional activator